MGERSERDEVDARLGDLAEVRHRDPAARLGLGAVADERHHRAQLIGRHVVEEEAGCAGLERLADLALVAALHLEQEVRRRPDDAEGREAFVRLRAAGENLYVVQMEFTENDQTRPWNRPAGE